MDISLLIIIFIAIEIFTDFIFSRTGKKIYSVLRNKEIDEEEFESKKFFFRIGGFLFWVSIYAIIFYAIKLF